MKNKINPWKMLCISLCLLILLIISFFLTSFFLDLSLLEEHVPEVLRDWLGNILGQIWEIGKNIRISGYDAAGMAVQKNHSMFVSHLDPEFIRTIGILILIPYGITLAGSVFAAFQNRWTKIVSFAAGIGSAGYMCYTTFVRIPQVLYDRISSVVPSDSGVLGKAADLLLERLGISVSSGSVDEISDLINIDLFRNIMKSGLGAGWWLLAAANVLLAAVGIVMFISLRSGEKTGASRRKGVPKAQKNHKPGILCEFGDLSGAAIPLNEGGVLLIGSDPLVCSLVIRAPQIEQLHCEISCQDGRYFIKNYSRSGVWMMDSGQQIMLTEKAVPAGSRIYLGDPANSIYLE